MSSNSDDIQAAGSDTRPPMLDRTDYESWSQRIRLYCRGKENGLQVLQSIDQGPFELGTTRDSLGTTPKGGVLLGPERPRFPDILQLSITTLTAKKQFGQRQNASGKMFKAIESESRNFAQEMVLAGKWGCTGRIRAGNAMPDKLLLEAQQENGEVLDEEELLFLADECDAFDSDVDDEPTAQSIFMANLSSVGSANPQAASLCAVGNYVKSEEDFVLADGKLYKNKLTWENELALVQKSLVTEVRAMKSVFENLEAEVDQNEIDLKSSEIEQKNLLIANENLIAECLSKDMFYTATDSMLNASRFFDMHDAFTTAQKRVKGASVACKSKPRSNTKKDRTLPAKSALKQVEAHSRMNKSNEKQKNHVDSSISYKRTVINSNSNTSCKTCNKCLISVNHDQCVVRSEIFGKQSPATKVVQIVLWYLDSGCSKHMTGDRSRLRNFVEKFIRTVRFGNDHFGAIMGYGDYVIGDSVISRVYYVEGLGHNLYSVGQFCDSNLEVAFRKHTCFVRDLDGIELIKGSRGTNLYTIYVEDMMRSSPIFLLSKASKNKSWLWHRRLNHLNFGTLNDLARKDLVRGLPRLKIPTGITHEKTVLRTPQQNGIVERQNRTLVEATRTMLIFSKAPLFLWAEAVANAYYT
ncbi:integrase, catalytic region, zinc finger, CCHC-type containing protein [Tanacetum coccineum]|uniref:Integrase, catalytic region, zinc finger, CCHC-type containing protein n=1 Tax=Tanacetum coccineum TaxID=301880 RepID=A0ABQ5FT53_9ASTR